MLAVCAASGWQRCEAVTEGDKAEDAIAEDLGVGLRTPRKSLLKRVDPYSRVKDVSTDISVNATSYAQGAETGL